MKWLAEIRKNARVRELFAYGVAGVLTTLVNLLVKYLVLLPFGREPDEFAVSLAIAVGWILSVAFAYWVNRQFVFHTGGSDKKTLMREVGSFVTARLLSLGLDWVFVMVAMRWLGVAEWPAMIVSNVLVVVANYFASRLWIFRKPK